MLLNAQLQVKERYGEGRTYREVRHHVSDVQVGSAIQAARSESPTVAVPLQTSSQRWLLNMTHQHLASRSTLSTKELIREYEVAKLTAQPKNVTLSRTICSTAPQLATPHAWGAD